MYSYMKPKTNLGSWLKNILRHRGLVVAVGITACALLITAILLWAPLPWQFAHKDTVPIVPIALTIKDHSDEWRAEYEGEVQGSGTHWLGHKGVNVPAGREGGLWYDGKLVAKETRNAFLKDYRISSNGEHYAYNQDVLRTDTDATTVSKIVVDGKEIVQGKGVLLYEITDTGDVYYSCVRCGENSNGFFRNDKKLVDKQDDTYWGGPGNSQQIPCLFKLDADIKHLTEALAATSSDVEITACSPNGKHIVRDKIESVQPEGTKDVLYINGSKLDDGNIENWVVNDEGELTYLKRDSPLPGLTSLTINGRGNYIISSVNDSWQILYSPSLKNIALVQNGKWWVNGRATGIDQSENVSLGDTAFYIYRF
jgi:hypothetical protein